LSGATSDPDVMERPDAQITVVSARTHIALSGMWTMRHGRALEAILETGKSKKAPQFNVDLSGIKGFDTLGALAVARLRQSLETAGAKVDFTGMSHDHELLLSMVNLSPQSAKSHKTINLVDILEDIGRAMANIGRDIVSGVSFLGGVMAAFGRIVMRPRTFRGAAFVRQLEAFGFRSVPIIALISFLVGGIIAQQSVFQLRIFGTTAFVADLLGILVLRELAVLLTAIMIAGRSGSAITAELGSMKMREEIDALRTMGLDPMEVLIVPRILALIVAMPILTFIAAMAGILGGGLVAWFYGDVSPDVFLTRLQGAIKFNTFMVGMIKAPVMALVIGLIASIEGMAVKGSAESLGRQTTASVVKAIFMVIVVDGLFAMFFAAINY
jgi:phospholipid/cholesterol/gamma-HCH transport system permease protein